LLWMFLTSGDLEL